MATGRVRVTGRVQATGRSNGELSAVFVHQRIKRIKRCVSTLATDFVVFSCRISVPTSTCTLSSEIHAAYILLGGVRVSVWVQNHAFGANGDSPCFQFLKQCVAAVWLGAGKIRRLAQVAAQVIELNRCKIE